MMKWLIAGALISLPHVASGEIEKTRLLDYKDWSVDHDYFIEDGMQGCSATTVNRSGDLFQLFLLPGGLSLLIMMAPDFGGWDGSFEADAIVHIDYEKWRLNNADFNASGRSTGGRTIAYTFQSRDVGDFIDDIWKGSKVALKSPQESRSIAVWSLDGSAAAIRKLGECAERVTGSQTQTRY